MMPDQATFLNCYNRGCGKKFDPNKNDADECQHHPGLPFFHDAYKGWSCCKKKCTDFTEFLNIKGCTLSKHSNEKPPEPPKKEVDKEKANEVIEVRLPAPMPKFTLARPPYDTPMVTLQPILSDSLKQQVLQAPAIAQASQDSNVIEPGTLCKNGGCNASYGGGADAGACTHHPGAPIFHEGLKFWSCCQKRTSDFTAFLNQVGCATGVHKWRKEKQAAGTVKCRWDWHQTPSLVVVAVYARQYAPAASRVVLSPVRLQVRVVFPHEGNSSFTLDVELRGVIDVEQSSVRMTPTKLEITMRKAEPMSWSTLDVPPPVAPPQPPPEAEKVPEHVEELDVDEDQDSVDLSCVEAVHSMGKVNIEEIK